MAVTPPGSFARLSVGPGGPWGSAQPVESSSIEDWMANHNHLYAALGTPIAMAYYGPGWVGASPWRDICVFWRPTDPDQRTLVAVVEVENTDSGDHNLQIVDGGTTTGAVISPGGPGLATIEWTPDSAAGDEFVLQADDSTIAVYSCTIHRKVLSGSLSDTPKDSGWTWMQSSRDSAADEPVSVELLNRALEGPYIIERNQPVTLMCLSDSPESARLAVKDTASEATLLAGDPSDGGGPHARLLGGLARTSSLRVRVAGRRRYSSLDGTITIQIAGISRVLTFSGSTSIPSAGGPYQWQSVDLGDVAGGFYELAVSCRNAELWAITVYTR